MWTSKSWVLPNISFWKLGNLKGLRLLNSPPYLFYKTSRLAKKEIVPTSIEFWVKTTLLMGKILNLTTLSNLCVKWFFYYHVGVISLKYIHIFNLSWSLNYQLRLQLSITILFFNPKPYLSIEVLTKKWNLNHRLKLNFLIEASIDNCDFIFELKSQLSVETLFLWKDYVTLTWLEKSHIEY